MRNKTIYFRGTGTPPGRASLLRGSTENIQQSSRKTRGDRIILRTGKLNRSHSSRQLISMTTFNLGVVCKLIFAFLPENICVDLSVR